MNIGSCLSIHDVAKADGVVLSNAVAWEVGAICAKKWHDIVGVLPMKDLRAKKNGPGSHCFAVYPPSWRQPISDVIRATNPPTSPQGSLPF